MDRTDWLPLTLFVGIVVVAGALVIWGVASEKKACIADGGRIISKPTVGVGIGGNGQTTTTVGSVRFCVTPDGRILW